MKRRREAILGGFAIAAIMLAMVASTVAYSTGGKYNIIEKKTAAQKVLIGQDLQFKSADWGASPPTINRYVSGDLSNTYTAETGTDGNYYIYNVNWPTSGAYYVNGNATTKDAQLDVEDPKIPLQLKVSDKIVSSLAKGTPEFHTDAGGINLFPEDKVDLVIMGPSGQIKTKNNQYFTDITVWDLTNYTRENINTADWDVGHYTFQVKTKPEYACGMDAQSTLRELNIIKATLAIEANRTSVIESELVKLTVTGVPGTPLNVREDTLSPNAYFPAWLYDNPKNRTTSNFYDTIDSDGIRVYAVEFNDTGTYTIKVENRDDPSMYDTVDITVTEKAVNFDVPGTVVIGQRFMINGTANTGNTVTVAVEDVVVPKLNNIVIDENGEFSEEIDTSSDAAPGGAFKNPGSVRLKAYIDYMGGTGTVPSGITEDGAATVFMLNDKGGGIDISASEVNVGKNETVIVTIAALPGHNVSVTTADTAHTVFEYNQYDFTGTSSNIIKIAPADTTSIPADIGDCDRQTNARNISGVWKTMDADSTQKFAVHFADTGTYKITATDFGTGYPTANRLDEEEIEINVTGKDVTFDLPSIVVIGDKIVIKGTSKRGSTVTIAVDDVVVPKLNNIVINAKGEFAEEIDTSSDAVPASFKISGLVRLKAYIDYIGGAGTVPSGITDDGSATVFMVSGWLTAGLSTGSVDPGDEFTVTGTAKGSRSVDILIVAPNGFSGSNIETDAKEMYYTSTGVSSTDGAFSKTIRVGDDVDTGRYLVVVLSAGSDGKWGMGGYDTLYNLSDPWNSALCQYVLDTRTQDEMLAIFDNIVGLSDDLIWVRHVAVGNADEDTTITIQKMYTYSCPGTGGHSEYAAIYAQNGTLLGKGSWKGYQYRDYQWITFDNPVTLELGIAYNYTIKTGSYPQIIHRPGRTIDNGSITCTDFIDANGRIYNDWIPAIRLE